MGQVAAPGDRREIAEMQVDSHRHLALGHRGLRRGLIVLGGDAVATSGDVAERDLQLVGI